MIDAIRIKTMRQRLGEASELIESDQYLPLYRNRQINHPELFAFSIKLARRKNKPSRYFAALWSSKNLAKTIDWLQKLINLAKSKAMEMVRETKQKAQHALESARLNREGRRRLEQMKKKMLQRADRYPMKT